MVTFKTAEELLQDREQRFLVFGDAKMGKTHLSLSIITMLKKKGYKPDDIFIGFIDADDGVAPLLKKGVVDSEYRKSIMYTLVTNFDEVVDATNELIKYGREHIKNHPKETAWLVVDNIQKVWEMVRDKYAQEIYGKSLFELMKKKKEEARMEGKKILPTFDMRSDYAIINPMHASWLMSINTSQLNYVLTAPDKTTEDEQTHSNVVSPRGQKDVKYSVDTIVYLSMMNDMHYAEVMGRFTRKPIAVREPSMDKILTEISKNIKS